MKDLKKAIQRSFPVRLVESWFRDISSQRTQAHDYYRNEKEYYLFVGKINVSKYFGSFNIG